LIVNGCYYGAAVGVGVGVGVAYMNGIVPPSINVEFRMLS